MIIDTSALIAILRGVDGICVLRYDNEAGKGDHRHIGKTEKHYNFTTPEVLLTDFWSDVDRWRR